MSEQTPPVMTALKSSDSRNIVLTGFMGVGKTTVGRILARKLRRGFLDTDAIITQRHGPITDIFARVGEDGFRDIERGVAAELGRERGLVVATGGRLMLDPANIRSLNRTGHVFALAATPAQVWSRVNQGSGVAKRPLLAGPDPLGRITELLAERGPLYHLFAQVAAGVRNADSVATEIIELFERTPTTLVSPDDVTSTMVGINLLAHLHGILANINRSLDPVPTNPATVDTEHNFRFGPLIGSLPTGTHVSIGNLESWQATSSKHRDTARLTVHCVTDDESIFAVARGEGDPNLRPELTVVDLAATQPKLPEHRGLLDAWDSTIALFTRAGWTMAEPTA